VSTCNCQAVKKSIGLTKRARAHRGLRKTLRHERRCYWTNDFENKKEMLIYSTLSVEHAALGIFTQYPLISQHVMVFLSYLYKEK